MIRKAEKPDLPACAALIRRSFLTVAEEFGITEQNAPRFTAFAVTKERLDWQFTEERRPMHLFAQEGRILGFYSLALLGEGRCELNNLCVHPDFRHRHIGEILLRHAVETAKAQGCTKMELGFVEENQRLREWYEGFGFVHTAQEKFDFFPFTCGYMEKALASEGENSPNP